MSAVHVCWKNYLQGVQARGFWDQSLLEWLFDQSGIFQFQHSESFPDDPNEGCVLVVPGHHRDNDKLNEDIRLREWVLLIITSDEEGLCPFWTISHPNLAIWKHTPRPDIPWQPDRALPLGWTPGTIEANQERPSKDWGLDWFFAGQVTHGRRQQAAEAMKTMTGGKLVGTSTFLDLEGGMGRQEYFDHLRRARVVPCPSGPNIPDTFRLYEALESGAVPLADATCPRGDIGYWYRAFPTVGFPIVDDWSQLPRLVEEWRTQPKRVSVLAWWQQAKRDLVKRLHGDIAALQSDEVESPMEQRITVLIPTSAIPSHPSLEIISETVASIRTRLPTSEILIMCDGVRPELAHREPDYWEYLEDLVWACRTWGATPFVFDQHLHQAAMTRRILEQVTTPLVLFVEHDTPLVGEIPWEQFGYWILNDDYHLIRFHHEAKIPKEHLWLMRGKETRWKDSHDYRFMRTVQWSQRPHLARTDKYREWLDTYFSIEARTMIEDRMHGIVERSEWEEFQVAIYHPPGSIQRSRHLDGRGTDSKYEAEMVF